VDIIMTVLKDTSTICLLVMFTSAISYFQGMMLHSLLMDLVRATICFWRGIKRVS